MRVEFIGNVRTADASATVIEVGAADPGNVTSGVEGARECPLDASS